MAAVTRLSLNGCSAAPYGSFAGKTEAVAVFATEERRHFAAIYHHFQNFAALILGVGLMRYEHGSLRQS